MTKRPALHLLALAAFVGLSSLAGCKHGKGGASCDAVGVRFLALAQADLAAAKELDGASRRGVAGMLAPMRDAMVRACREDGWSPEARACFIASADPTQFQACERTLSEPQRELLRKAAGGAQ